MILLNTTPSKGYLVTVAITQLLFFFMLALHFYLRLNGVDSVLNLPIASMHFIVIAILCGSLILGIYSFVLNYQLSKINSLLKYEIKERQQAESILRQLTDNMLDIIYKTSLHGDIVYISPSQKFLLGYENQELIDQKFFKLLHSDDVESVVNLFHESIKNKTAYRQEFRFKCKDGNFKWLEATVNHLSDPKGSVVGSVFCCREITWRKQLENAQALERQRLFSLLDSLPAFVLLIQKDHSIKFMNKYFLEHFGPFYGRSCFEALASKDYPCEVCIIAEVFESKTPKSFEFADYKGRTYEILAYPFFDVDGTTLVLELGIDITDRKQLQKELIRMDRLNLIGEMAAGIGHEIRNPMTTVRGFLQMIASKEQSKDYREYYKLMIEELDRANTIITEYLNVAKTKEADKKVQNINDIINSILPLLVADAIKDDKYINVQMEKVPNLLLDDKEIRQIILNLVRNGLDAMQPGQYLTIRTYLENDCVALAVQDEGEGINPEVLDKIGTPFFTTKDTGTGLGLSVCYGIANRHNAELTIESDEKGTTVSCHFKTELGES